MLTEQEREILEESRVSHFGAYLQATWLQYPNLQNQITQQRYPSQKTLVHLNKDMKERKFDFDEIYFYLLPTQKTNPLRIEQQAWHLLSPYVGQHVSNFGVYIATYSVQTVNQGELLAHIDIGWTLLQKWHLISQSFKAKQNRNWDEVEGQEQTLEHLIQELQQTQPTD